MITETKMQYVLQEAFDSVEKILLERFNGKIEFGHVFFDCNKNKCIYLGINGEEHIYVYLLTENFISCSLESHLMYGEQESFNQLIDIIYDSLQNKGE